MRCVPLRRALLRGAKNNRALLPAPLGLRRGRARRWGQGSARCDAGYRAKSSSREVKFENLGWVADEEMRAVD